MPSPNLSDSNKRALNRNAYLAAGSAVLAGSLLLALPIATSAFWPFSTPARAANDGGDPPILHDSGLALLEGATNSDPNPEKGGADVTLTEDSALMAASGPAGTLADIVSPDTSTTGEITTYVVQEGDSISGIAAKYGVSVNTILWANNLTVKSAIKPGMNLVILPISGIRHTVQKGETLGSIAKKYGGDATEIATFNGLDAGDALVSGTSLIIPGGEATIASTPVKKPTKTGSAAPLPAASGSSGSTSGYFDNPVPGAILTQGLHLRYGVDLGAPAGTPIHAAASGTVIVSKGDGAWNGGYGSYVVISHANGTQTLYAHMSKDVVAVGEKVSQGDVIGYVGRTGEATGNHLHFEVRGAKNPIASSCTVMRACY